MRYSSVCLVIFLILAARGQTPPPQNNEPIPPLIEAVWNRDVARVQQLLEAGEDPDGKGATPNGIPPWYWAIFTREDRAAELMLEKVKDVNRPMPERVMPRRYGLLMAANGNQVAIARALLDRGAPVDARARNNSTPLMIAASSGYSEMIKLLIDRHADVKLQDDHGDNALIAAVRAGSLASIKALLGAGADVNQKDKASRTALHWAARCGRVDIVNALLAAGADQDAADQTGRTALTVAAERRQTGVVKLLKTMNAKGEVTALSQPLPTAKAAVERSLPLIQRAATDWTTRAGCPSCHHPPMMFRAIGLAARQGFSIDKQMLEAQIEAMHGVSKMTPALRSMNPAQQISFNLRHGEGDLVFLGWIQSSFIDAGIQKDDDQQTLATFVSNLQLPDGRWRCGPPRVPLVSSDIASTASALRALQHYGPRDDAETRSHIQRGTDWLRAATPVTTDDKAYRLFGLHWTQSEPGLIRQATDLLLKEQNSDGGWSQLRGLNSDAYATGLVLVALHEAGGLRITDGAYRRGVQNLLKMQERDGSWLVHTRTVSSQKYFESGSPHGKFQFISYAGTCWATMALAYAALPR